MAWIEPSDYADPEAILIAREEGEDIDSDFRESMIYSSMHRAKSFEREREQGDTMGYSPAELCALQFSDREVH